MDSQTLVITVTSIPSPKAQEAGEQPEIVIAGKMIIARSKMAGILLLGAQEHETIAALKEKKATLEVICNEVTGDEDC